MSKTALAPVAAGGIALILAAAFSTRPGSYESAAHVLQHAEQMSGHGQRATKAFVAACIRTRAKAALAFACCRCAPRETI